MEDELKKQEVADDSKLTEEQINGKFLAFRPDQGCHLAFLKAKSAKFGLF